MPNGLHPRSISGKESENTLVPQPIASPVRTTMTNAIIESIVNRSTTKYYDPAVTLGDDQIRELVRIATSRRRSTSTPPSAPL
jgi:hypothetical protein